MIRRTRMLRAHCEYQAHCGSTLYTSLCVESALNALRVYDLPVLPMTLHDMSLR